MAPTLQAQRRRATGPITSAQRAKMAQRILAAPPVQWRTLAARIPAGYAQEVASTLEAIAQQAIRAAAYLTHTGHSLPITDTMHAHGVDRQNREVRRIRKALGFAYPDSPITF